MKALFAFVVFVLLLMAVPRIVCQQAAGNSHTSETFFRSWARTQVMPSYPRAAMAHHQTGVVVVEVHLDASSRVSSVRVLQSPSGDFDKEVLAALPNWKFYPPAALGHNGITAKLTFYFLLIDRQYRVLDPTHDEFEIDHVNNMIGVQGKEMGHMH